MLHDEFKISSQWLIIVMYSSQMGQELQEVLPLISCQPKKVVKTRKKTLPFFDLLVLENHSVIAIDRDSNRK